MGKIIDHAQLNEAVDNDQDVIDVIAQTYLDTYEELYSALKNAYDEKAPDELSRAAHTLKGAISMFFNEALANELQKLEIEAKEGKIRIEASDIEQIKDTLDMLATELKELISDN
ncbi:MAG: hypothetical protein CME67_01400 [Halobacteriovoraceae bacterium]|nr:hypothetical protein [Halobacteriovoraceae bacterium]|tara:strand:- start:2408 stop:2752 length:345 start_codon:yes stop_codon:yes gene_type:complete